MTAARRARPPENLSAKEAIRAEILYQLSRGPNSVMTVTAFLLAAGGLVLLFLGGEVLLRGAVGLALRSGVSPLLIGLTIVAFATSMPELMVTVTAGLEGATDVGIGNVVGSNIANILLILGTAAVISPIATEPRQIMRDAAMMIGATALFIVFALMGALTFVHGGIMLAALVIYLYVSYRMETGKDGDNEAQLEALEEAGKAPGSPLASVLLVLLGIGGLVAGSEMLVEGAVDIARALGISEAVIGLTLVAIGTSLPELATAIVAGLRGHTEVGAGQCAGLQHIQYPADPRLPHAPDAGGGLGRDTHLRYLGDGGGDPRRGAGHVERPADWPARRGVLPHYLRGLHRVSLLSWRFLRPPLSERPACATPTAIR